MKEFDRFSFPRNYSGKVPLFFQKFPEKFRRKFPEISELTTLFKFHLLLMYYMIPRMRNANFVNKYGDFGTLNIYETV